MRALAVEGLTKAYPRFTLDKVSLTLEQGRIMGLIGKNGAGKSTLLKSLLHLVSPDAGTITLLGRPFPEGELESRQELGVVLGGIDFYRHKRLDAITAVTRRFYRRWDEKACRRYMEAFELDGRKRVGELSAGMRFPGNVPGKNRRLPVRRPRADHRTAGGRSGRKDHDGNRSIT